MRNRSWAVVIAVVLWSASAVAAGPPEPEESTVWWVTETYKPSKRKIEGIRVRDIDPTWARALPLSKGSLSDEGQKYLKTKVTHLIHFWLDGDFNDDKVADRAVVGVYERVTGEKGKFFLILTRSSTRGWKKAFLGQHEGKPGFSYITKDGDKLGWIECFECDAGEGIVWTKEKGYQFEVNPDVPAE